MQAGKTDWLAGDIRRVLAPNPSAMTGPGTNTYVLGQSGGLTVVDPGPDDPAHLQAVLAAVGTGNHIAAILVTHAHRDHSAGAPRLSALTGAPVLAFGDASSGRSPVMETLAALGLAGGGEGVDTDFHPGQRVTDGQILDLGDHRIEVLHTPGHMGGHICLRLRDVLFSGDHAMGWASSLVSPPDGDMGAYMGSLERLARQRWTAMLPGHGAEVTAVADRLADLLAHRRQREAEVLAALLQGPASATDLTARIYHDTPAALLGAASRNVLAHLIDLLDRNLLHCDGPPRPEARFTRT